MKNLLLFVLFLVATSSFAQKRIVSTVESDGLKGVFVDSDAIFKVKVTAAETDKITLKTEIEGETFNTMRINTEIKNGLLVITSGRSLDYEPIDDKLAAHKVMSIELSMTIPEGFELWVDSSLASVWAEGHFGYINCNLSSGDCRLLRFRGSGVINTQTGNIVVETHQTKINAHTRNGKLALDNEVYGTYDLKLSSIDGDIAVVQSK